MFSFIGLCMLYIFIYTSLSFSFLVGQVVIMNKQDLNEYWDKFIMGFECDHCGRHFPKSVLVNMNYGHKQLDGRYCVVCSHKIYDKMGYCDECDEQYPKSHLYVNAVDKSTLCKGCIGRLHFEKEEDY
jgi:hypothetical protein